MKQRLILLLAAAFCASACGLRLVRRLDPPGLVVFMSDFGTRDDAVAIAKGVMLEQEPRLRLVDLTHEVTPFSIREGARLLAGTVPHYARGTVFLCVVDPGVGSTRKPIVARTRAGRRLALPDNGLLTLLDEVDPIEEVREITNPRWMRGEALSSTFHGRDIFAPAAAMLATGASFGDAGPLVREWVRLPVAPARLSAAGIEGEVLAIDGPYGNLMTDVGAALFAKLGYTRGENVPVIVGDKTLSLPFVKTFSDVPEGEGLLYVDSRGRIGMAVNKGHFARVHGITPPTLLRIRAKETRP